MNRRDFIKTTAIVSVGLAIAPAVVWADSKQAVWHVGIPLPEELREAHQFMLDQGYSWFDLFGKEPVDDDPFTQSEYLHNQFDTTTKITVRQYHTGEHWMLQNPEGKWRVVHKSWVKDVLHNLVYAQKQGFTYKGAIYNGINNIDTFIRPDGSILEIFT
jgi:hypothetical protein